MGIFLEAMDLTIVKLIQPNQNTPNPHFSYAPLAGDNQGHPATPSHRQVQNRHTHINRNAFD
jgi:hypothetical protein